MSIELRRCLPRRRRQGSYARPGWRETKGNFEISFSLLRRLIRIFQVDATLTMHPGVAMNAKPESFPRDLVVHAITELDTVFLKRLVTRGVIQYLPADAGVGGTQDILLGTAPPGPHAQTRHHPH